ncbi:cerebellin-3-like [Anguilla rostrata]|uniref:cerebellin-3-like n=1 Tax=Anguilla rostrata TaxID=7938 RepID=UPI0030D23B78
MNSGATYTNDRSPSSKVFMDTIPGTENTYESLHANVYTCLDRTAPSNRSTEAKSSAGREYLYRKISLVFVSLWLITLITLIVGMVLHYDQRSAIQREIEVLKNSPSKLIGGTPKVAFAASLANHSETKTIGPYSEAVTVVYTHVITNVGGAYNQSTGIFTVPIRGVYYFSFTAFGWINNAAIAVSLFVNHEFFMSAYDNNPGPGRGATNTITLQLEIGDIIYLKLRADMQLHDNGNLYNTFNGHLLFPI